MKKEDCETELFQGLADAETLREVEIVDRKLAALKKYHETK